jgi:MobC-like protein
MKMKVMKDQEPLKEWISFRVKPEEYDKIYKLFQLTTCRKLSEYSRKVLLNKPVVIKYRNQSADSFLEEMILLKNELSAIGNNFNQAVKRLHSLDTGAQMKSWLIVYDSMHRSFANKVEEIKERLNQIYELWSQK